MAAIIDLSLSLSLNEDTSIFGFLVFYLK